MKTAILLAVLAFCLSACSSPDIFRANAAQGYIMHLDTGWTYQKGDDRAWANPLYDDSRWDRIDPLQDIYLYLEKNPGPHTAWLRLNFSVPTNWPQEQLALSVNQSVAS